MDQHDSPPSAIASFSQLLSPNDPVAKRLEMEFDDCLRDSSPVRARQRSSAVDMLSSPVESSRSAWRTDKRTPRTSNGLRRARDCAVSHESNTTDTGSSLCPAVIVSSTGNTGTVACSPKLHDDARTSNGLRRGYVVSHDNRCVVECSRSINTSRACSSRDDQRTGTSLCPDVIVSSADNIGAADCPSKLHDDTRTSNGLRRGCVVSNDNKCVVECSTGINTARACSSRDDQRTGTSLCPDVAVSSAANTSIVDCSPKLRSSANTRFHGVLPNIDFPSSSVSPSSTLAATAIDKNATGHSDELRIPSARLVAFTSPAQLNGHRTVRNYSCEAHNDRETDAALDDMKATLLVTHERGVKRSVGTAKRSPSLVRAAPTERDDRVRAGLSSGHSDLGTRSALPHSVTSSSTCNTHSNTEDVPEIVVCEKPGKTTPTLTATHVADTVRDSGRRTSSGMHVAPRVSPAPVVPSTAVRRRRRHMSTQDSVLSGAHTDPDIARIWSSPMSRVETPPRTHSHAKGLLFHFEHEC